MQVFNMKSPTQEGVIITKQHSQSKKSCLARAQNDAINERTHYYSYVTQMISSFDVLAVPHGHNLTPLGGVNTFVPPMRNSLDNPQ